MNPLTLEWIDKAEGDYVTTLREMRARKFPNYDASCFHAQQMAEKYLKAFLQENDMPVPRTHNLIELLALSSSHDSTLAIMRSDLILLDRYAVRFRYPGESANKEEAKTAWQSAKVVRQFLRVRLGLIP
jgi:HEPN domain-containing protein